MLVLFEVVDPWVLLKLLRNTVELRKLAQSSWNSLLTIWEAAGTLFYSIIYTPVLPWAVDARVVGFLQYGLILLAGVTSNQDCEPCYVGNICFHESLLLRHSTINDNK